MKKSLVYSLILHILLVALILFLAEEKDKKGAPPFFARIITPEELREGGQRQTKTIPAPKAFPPLAAKPSRPQMPPKTPLADHLQKEPKVDQGINNTGSTSHEFPVPYKEGQQKSQIGKALDETQSGKDLIESVSPYPTIPLKERLFDSSVIGKLAQKEKEDTKPESNITFDTKEYKYYGYMQRLKEKIEGIWKYPQDAAEKGLYGDLYIRFTIKKNGQLGAVELLRTSGHASLDSAAIKALRDAEPYWPLPDEWGKDGFTITGHFIYTLHGAYIR